MIKIDLSKVIPKRLGTYLLGFIPGVVFELTVAFGDPVMAHRMIERVKDVYPFQGYALLALFAASCLVVGQTFFLLAWFTDWTIEFLYRTYWFLILHLTLGSNWLYKACQGRSKSRPLWRSKREPLNKDEDGVVFGGEGALERSGRGPSPPKPRSEGQS
jgi:hypothetical protein